MRWVGIDEAGYGPNLGPLVMTAVVAETLDDRPPDVWSDLAPNVTKAGGAEEAVWVDDSKKVYRARKNFHRLEAATHAVLAATRQGSPCRLVDLIEALELPDEARSASELDRWLDGSEPLIPRPGSHECVAWAVSLQPFQHERWHLVEARTVVVAPEQFNQLLGISSNKARVHFHAFERLLHWIWREHRGQDAAVSICSDKHGGRNFYQDLLHGAFPGVWITRGIESRAVSKYSLREGSSPPVEIAFRVGADGDDGLVALASMIGKTIREHWMDVFNAFWIARVADLEPTAGYPGDSTRFRTQIEPICPSLGLAENQWWRSV